VRGTPLTPRFSRAPEASPTQDALCLPMVSQVCVLEVWLAVLVGVEANIRSRATGLSVRAGRQGGGSWVSSEAFA
jgi:hypothetical protein